MTKPYSNFNIISYCTRKTPYEQVMQEYLLKSIYKLEEKGFSLPYTVQYIDSMGSWNKNTAYKAKFILDNLDSIIFDNIVCVDCDATIESYPQLFNEIPDKYDMACHMLDWESWYCHTPGRKELLTGTILFKSNRENVKKLVEEWYNIAMKTNEWEQKVLEKLVKQYDIKIYDLPLSYCYINSLPNGKEPNVKCDNVVVRHYQSSRTLKKLIK